MTTDNFISKYPDVSDAYGIINLNSVGDILSTFLKLQRTNDTQSLKSLGLQDFQKDMRKVFGETEEYKKLNREKKLKRILK